MEVEYKNIENFPGYRLGTDGTIWSFKANRWKLKGISYNNGLHPYVFLRKNGINYGFPLDKLILETFIGQCPDGLVCKNRSGNLRDCSLNNLEWGKYDISTVTIPYFDLGVDGVEYRDVPNYIGYRVSDIGEIFSCIKRGGVRNKGEIGDKWYRLKPLFHKRTGRNYIYLYNSDGRIRDTIYHIILLAFVGPMPSGMEVRHLDGNRINDRLSNLVYGTKKENAQDKFLHGTSIRGKNNPLVKLTEEKVIEIKEKVKTMKISHIAKEYKVGTNAISSIKNNKTWNYINKGDSDNV